jgi:hypothetical protein
MPNENLRASGFFAVASKKRPCTDIEANVEGSLVLVGNDLSQTGCRKDYNSVVAVHVFRTPGTKSDNLEQTFTSSNQFRRSLFYIIINDA